VNPHQGSSHADAKPMFWSENAAFCGTPLDHQEVTRVLHIPQIRREKGQTMAEYGVVLAVITVMCLSALTLLSGNVTSALVRVAGLVGLAG